MRQEFYEYKVSSKVTLEGVTETPSFRLCLEESEYVWRPNRSTALIPVARFNSICLEMLPVKPQAYITKASVSADGDQRRWRYTCNLPKTVTKS